MKNQTLLNSKRFIAMKNAAIRAGKVPCAWKISRSQWEIFIDSNMYDGWKSIAPHSDYRELFGLPVFDTEGDAELVTQ